MLRILAVDDNYESSHSLALFLRMDGHEVRVAQDGPSALSILDEFPADVLFLDI